MHFPCRPVKLHSSLDSRFLPECVGLSRFPPCRSSDKFLAILQIAQNLIQRLPSAGLKSKSKVCLFVPKESGPVSRSIAVVLVLVLSLSLTLYDSIIQRRAVKMSRKCRSLLSVVPVVDIILVVAEEY